MDKNEIIDRVARIANDYGLRGQKITVQWIAPRSATDDPRGIFVIIPKERGDG